jgi:sporulation protein YlmC with PRC-barrel domain
MLRKQFLKTIFSLIVVFGAATLLLPVTNEAAEQAKEPGSNIMAENIMDMEVRTTAGEEIGEIEDVIFSRKGKVKEFVIDVGGFLGIGEKRVVVSTKELRYDSDKSYAVYQGTRGELEDKPEIDYRDYRYIRGHYPYRPPYGSYPYGGYDPYYYPPHWARQYPPPGYYGNDYEQQRRAMEAEKQMRSRRAYRRRHLEERPRYFSSSRSRDLSMETIIDTDVQSRNGDIIGEIENLVVDRRGRITHAIIDVGGFLGIGDKQVAVPFDRLEDIGPYFVMYPGTEAQLESMTAFDPSKSVGMKQDKDQE